MNPQLENFINNKKQELQIHQQQRRGEHLVSLGLIDESKTKVERIILENDSEAECQSGVKYDASLNKYYIEEETKFPIDITEEEYQELLKYLPKEEKEKIKESEANKNTSEDLIALNKILKVLAIILMILGLFFTFVNIDDIEFEPGAFIVGIILIISSISIFIKRVLVKGFIVIVENVEYNKCN